MIQYPAELPIPIQDGYDINHVNPLLRTDLASGRARQRRRFTSVPSNVSVQWRMSQGQALYFELFFKDVLLDGAEWFDMPLRTPMGVKSYRARFTGIYSGPTLEQGVYWRFSATLELFERPTMPKEWALFPEYVTNASIIDYAVSREWPRA